MSINVSINQSPRQVRIGEQLLEIHHKILEKCEKEVEQYPLKKLDRITSRDNLLAYLAFREFDLHELQMELAEEGLSSLGRLENHVLASIEKVLGYLNIHDTKETALSKQQLHEAISISDQRAEALLGEKPLNRNTSIMVTLDSSMLTHPEVFEDLLLKGMDLARINCAHDTAKEWKEMIKTLRKKEEKLRNQGLYNNRECNVYMDLGGPKIRIGKFELEKRPLKLSIPRDVYGNIKRVVEGFIDVHAEYTDKLEENEDNVSFVIAVDTKIKLHKLKVGAELTFRDTRGRSRKFRVIGIEGDRVRVTLERTSYLDEGTELITNKGDKLVVRSLKPKPVQILVKKGDYLRVYRDPNQLGHSSKNGEPAGVAAMLPEAFENVLNGDRVFIDDGKIGGKVVDINEEYVELEIILPTVKPTKVKEEKGLNFPDTVLGLPALTEQDLADLPFIVEHADTVGLSFVHTRQDLVDLKRALTDLGRPDMAVVAKLETSDAIQNLAQILLAGFSFEAFGVMIARGDLAVEVGFENLAIVQEDILCMCDAAHTPVIWATQVLERLAKEGVPARAEITDAAMGHRAECVMLNKGPHIVDAVQVLSKLLTTEARHHIKKRQVFSEFTKQHGIFNR